MAKKLPETEKLSPAEMELSPDAQMLDSRALDANARYSMLDARC
jgi:hypothetical protein